MAQCCLDRLLLFQPGDKPSLVRSAVMGHHHRELAGSSLETRCRIAANEPAQQPSEPVSTRSDAMSALHQIDTEHRIHVTMPRQCSILVSEVTTPLLGLCRAVNDHVTMSQVRPLAIR